MGTGVIGTAPPPSLKDQAVAKLREVYDKKDEWEARRASTPPSHPELGQRTQKAIQALKPSPQTSTAIANMEGGMGTMAKYVPGWAPVAVAFSNRHVIPAYSGPVKAVRDFGVKQTGLDKAVAAEKADWEAEEERARRLTEE